jgi:uncharacterized MAPEG superfamily protein
MKPEMILLLWAVALAFVQVLVAANGAFMQVGLGALAGNRENLPAITGWAGRAQRAHRNMMENLPLFIALVLVGAAAQKSNEMTVLGAQLFFWGRFAYALLYIGGIPWLRTGAWAVSVAGMVLMFLQLIK